MQVLFTLCPKRFLFPTSADLHAHLPLVPLQNLHTDNLKSEMDSWERTWPVSPIEQMFTINYALLKIEVHNGNADRPLTAMEGVGATVITQAC